MVSCFYLSYVFLLFRSLTLAVLLLSFVVEPLHGLLVWLGFTLPDLPLLVELLAIVEHLRDLSLCPFLFICHFFHSGIMFGIMATIATRNYRCLLPHFISLLAPRCIGGDISVISLDNIDNLKLVQRIEALIINKLP